MSEQTIDLDEWGRKPRQTTERTHGVWTTCDHCHEDWWCIATDWDFLDDPTEFGCSGGCDDGWDPGDLLDDYDYDPEEPA
jgi:hypothetical protein